MISFHSITTYFLRREKKQECISTASAYFAWFAILVCGSSILIVGGVFAYYSFTTIDSSDSVISAEVPTTVKYNKERVEAVLMRYRDHTRYFENARNTLPLATPQSTANDTLPTQSSAEDTLHTSTTTTNAVASSTEVGVE